MRVLPTAAIFGVAAAIIAAGVQLHLSFFSPASTAPPLEYSTCTPLITRSPVREISLAELLATNHDLTEPVVVRGGMKGRPAERLWSPEYFIQAAEEGLIPSEFLVKRSKTPVVQFANLRASRPFVASEKVMEDAQKWPRMSPFTVPFTSHNVSVSDFFSELLTPASAVREWPYFADGLSVIHRLAPDMMPLSTLCPFADINRCDMSLWIGRSPVVAYPHYDSSHNLFWQVRGRKQFVLAGQKATRCGAGLFPSLHPLYRQVQRDVMDPEADFSRMKLFIPSSEIPQGKTCCELPLQEVTLEAGDVLRMPAGTFHRVSSLSTPSWSVNSWWHDSSVTRAFDEVFRVPLPFQAEWTERQMALATKVYVRGIYEGMEEYIRSVDPTAPRGSFLAKELLVTRFHPLFEERMTRERCDELRAESASSTADADIRIVTAAAVPLSDLLSLLPAEQRSKHASSSRSELLAALQAHFEPYVSRVLGLYAGIALEWRRVHVQNYVEEILWYTMDGRVDLLYPYVACAVAHETN
jgi:hypothetical protein